MKRLDMGWGNPYFLLQILRSHYQPTCFDNFDPMDMTYAPDEGSERLLEHVDSVTRQINNGKGYANYIITNGATQAINTVMRVMTRHYNTDTVYTPPLGYPFLNGMIQKTENLSRLEIDFEDPKDLKCIPENSMVLVDSPSNPLGLQREKWVGSANVAWDAVYHNPIYNHNPYKTPYHEVYINSFSKLLGVTGLRVGWIGVDNPVLYHKLLNDSLMENATVSKLSQDKIVKILDTIYLERFMEIGKKRLNYNREDFQKLKKITGQDAQECGMFYCVKADKKLYELFDKALIDYVRLKHKGDDMIRLNMGQTLNTVINFTKRIEKIDGVK